MEKDHRVDKQSQQEIDEHTTNHDQQSLPSGFRTEFPRLFGLLHLLGIETLVDHTCNLTIAAQRQPAYTILGIAVFGLPFEETAVPFPDARVEKQIELLDAHAEKLRKEEMAPFMEQRRIINISIIFLPYLHFYFFISSAAMRRASASVAI